ncbi:hypothetical protein DERP_012218 [Dermatophagoides pteronyssinus]|uniref:Uncharacterized protein n=1 Tax=Dermatophagoides pteronyssinus TaxID=6956 RepID=A0ABQ8JFV0_DERPT|nr:hypothetical protein DERP_012218 [Dermatophagoides pteronyssinus]
MTRKKFLFFLFYVTVLYSDVMIMRSIQRSTFVHGPSSSAWYNNNNNDNNNNNNVSLYKNKRGKL